MAKVVLVRFIRGFVASAISAMVIVVPSTVSSWNDLGGWLSSLAVAAIAGGLSGALLALDKSLRFSE